jgi:hypothetical protein
MARDSYAQIFAVTNQIVESSLFPLRHHGDVLGRESSATPFAFIHLLLNQKEDDMKSLIASLLCAGCLAMSSMGASAADYVVTTGPLGIYVLHVTSAGVTAVPGNPFVPTPVPGAYKEQTQPLFISLDATGEFLYALYEDGYYETLWSFRMINGVPYQISSFTAFDYKSFYASAMTVTPHYVFVGTSNEAFYGSIGHMQIFGKTNGMLAPLQTIDFGTWLNTLNPTSIQVDSNEQFAYVGYASGPPSGSLKTYGNCIASQCVAVINISGVGAGIAPRIEVTTPMANGLLVGAQ